MLAVDQPLKQDSTTTEQSYQARPHRRQASARRSHPLVEILIYTAWASFLLTVVWMIVEAADRSFDVSSIWIDSCTCPQNCGPLNGVDGSGIDVQVLGSLPDSGTPYRISAPIYGLAASLSNVLSSPSSTTLNTITASDLLVANTGFVTSTHLLEAAPETTSHLTCS